MGTKKHTVLNPANKDLLTEKLNELVSIEYQILQNLAAIKFRKEFVLALLENKYWDTDAYVGKIDAQFKQIHDDAVQDIINLNKGIVEGNFNDSTV